MKHISEVLIELGYKKELITDNNGKKFIGWSIINK